MIHTDEHLEKSATSELAIIRIHRIDAPGDPYAMFGDYSVEVLVEKGEALGIHQRGLTGFKRLEGNCLSLLMAALVEFLDNPEVFQLAISPHDMARPRRRTLRKLQRRKS